MFVETRQSSLGGWGSAGHSCSTDEKHRTAHAQFHVELLAVHWRWTLAARGAGWSQRACDGEQCSLIQHDGLKPHLTSASPG